MLECKLPTLPEISAAETPEIRQELAARRCWLLREIGTLRRRTEEEVREEEERKADVAAAVAQEQRRREAELLEKSLTKMREAQRRAADALQSKQQHATAHGVEWGRRAVQAATKLSEQAEQRAERERVLFGHCELVHANRDRLRNERVDILRDRNSDRLRRLEFTRDWAESLWEEQRSSFFSKSSAPRSDSRRDSPLYRHDVKAWDQRQEEEQARRQREMQEKDVHKEERRFAHRLLTAERARAAQERNRVSEVRVNTASAEILSLRTEQWQKLEHRRISRYASIEAQRRERADRLAEEGQRRFLAKASTRELARLRREGNDGAAQQALMRRVCHRSDRAEQLQRLSPLTLHASAGSFGNSASHSDMRPHTS
eukprot:Hpha_TRINITY_DN13885_c0_g2::TRINITY_DN13885_c0_g2_i3::g.69870::m.69870